MMLRSIECLDVSLVHRQTASLESEIIESALNLTECHTLLFMHKFAAKKKPSAKRNGCSSTNIATKKGEKNGIMKLIKSFIKAIKMCIFFLSVFHFCLTNISLLLLFFYCVGAHTVRSKERDDNQISCDCCAKHLSFSSLAIHIDSFLLLFFCLQSTWHCHLNPVQSHFFFFFLFIYRDFICLGIPIKSNEQFGLFFTSSSATR